MGTKLSLLLDTCADVSLFKPDNLDKSTKFDPDDRIKLKSAAGSIIET